MPKVSVIIPTCNRAGFLRGAIDSVLSQTFQDFEIVVVDDASTDNTPEIVACFHDERIKFIRHKSRKGAAIARNTGITNSKCDYIAFLDDDDEWFPDKLAKQMAVMLASPLEVALVYTGYYIVDRASGEITGQMIPTKSGDLSEALLIGNCIGGTSCVLVKKDCFKKVGMFDEALPPVEDYDLWIRISRSFHFDYVKEPLLKYNVHPQSISKNLHARSRGLEILLLKHGNSPQFKRNFSYRYLSLGVDFCYSRDTGQALKSFLKAIKLYPFEFRHYFNLCLSLLGPEIFVKVKEAKTNVLGILHKKISAIDLKE